MKTFLSLLLILLVSSGCSVGMAMSGKKNPDLGAVRVGSTRGEIELHLGTATKINTLEDGTRVDIYEYEIGNEPSAGRAVFHGCMDILTLGIWEIFGTPVEGFQGEKYYLTVKYDKDDKVLAINRCTPPPKQAQAQQDDKPTTDN